MSETEHLDAQGEELYERTALSRKEAEVLLRKELSRTGELNKDMAEEMGIDPSTFSNHLKNAKAKIENENIELNYAQFYNHAGSELSILHRPVFEVSDGSGRLILFERLFDEGSAPPFVIAHHYPEQAVTDTVGVTRGRMVMDWYQFEMAEQVAEGVLSTVQFDESGSVGSVSPGVFADKFEDHFGFDPKTVENAFSLRGRKVDAIPEEHLGLFKPGDSHTDIIAKLSEEYERFAEFMEGRTVDDIAIWNPLVTDEATVVVSAGRDQAVLSFDDSVYLELDDQCDCGHTNDFSPRMGEASKSSYRRRREESCQHRVARLNSTSIAHKLSTNFQRPRDGSPASPCCPVCGCTVVRHHKIRNKGEWTMSKYSCAACDTHVAHE